MATSVPKTMRALQQSEPKIDVPVPEIGEQVVAGNFRAMRHMLLLSPWR